MALSLLLSLTLAAARPDGFAVFGTGGMPAAELPAAGVLTGMATVTEHAGIPLAILVDEPRATERFSAWLQSVGLSAVRVGGDGRQLLPAVLVRLDPSLEPKLSRFGAVRALGGHGIYRITLGPGLVDPAAVARAVAGAVRTAWVEPDEWLAFSRRAVTFDDPDFAKLWHLHPVANPSVAANAHVRADEAWTTTLGQGGAGRAVVAVLDDGFSLTHPDLVAQYFSDGDGPVRKDFIGGDDDPSPPPGDGHGTRVLGVAVARGNNGVGGTGVCPECRAIPVRLFSSVAFEPDKLFGPASLSAEAFRWAASKGARVINNSWGPLISKVNPVFVPLPAVVDAAISDLVRQAAPSGPPGSAGVLLVWAAGNNNRQLVGFDGWAADPRVMSVSASNAAAELSDFSNIGPQIDLLAPGGSSGSALPSLSTTDGSAGYTDGFKGTSAAAPVVAGAAALVLAAFPELTLAQLFEVLLDSAEKIDAVTARYRRDGHSCTHGRGRLDVRAALDLAQARQAIYASGLTLAYELCGDGLDNDGDPGTPDDQGGCATCIPTRADDPAGNGDEDCDGVVDQELVCVRTGLERCAQCTSDGECQDEFRCLDHAGAKFCLAPCAIGMPCVAGESCQAGLCLPVLGGEVRACSDVSHCAPSNGGIETCDDRDNDCNGTIDDLAPAGGETQQNRFACQRGQVGVCAERDALCRRGAWSCVDVSFESEESTLDDGLDNDCDGRVDEGGAPSPPPSTDPSSAVARSCGASGDHYGWWPAFVFWLMARRRAKPQRPSTGTSGEAKSRTSAVTKTRS